MSKESNVFDHIKEPKHCDDYIDDYAAPACLRVFLSVNRLPAVTKMAFDEMGIKPTLFADYQGKRWRVVMASRMGDVGITEKLNAENGYTARVAVEELSNFGAVR